MLDSESSCMRFLESPKRRGTIRGKGGSIMRRLFVLALTLLFVTAWAESSIVMAREFSLQENQNTQANASTAEVSKRRHRRRHRRHFRRTVVSKTKAVGEKSKEVGETTVEKSKTVGGKVVDKSKTVGRKTKQTGDTVVDKSKTVGQKSKETGEKVVDKTKKVVKPPQ